MAEGISFSSNLYILRQTCHWSFETSCYEQQVWSDTVNTLATPKRTNGPEITWTKPRGTIWEEGSARLWPSTPLPLRGNWTCSWTFEKKNETTTLLFDKFSCFQQKKIEKVNSRVILNDEKSQFEASFSDKVTLLLKTSTLRTSMCFDDRVFYIFLRQAHQAIRTYQCSTWTEQSILRILLRKQPAQRPCHCYRKLGLWGF